MVVSPLYCQVSFVGLTICADELHRIASQRAHRVAYSTSYDTSSKLTSQTLIVFSRTAPRTCPICRHAVTSLGELFDFLSLITEYHHLLIHVCQAFHSVRTHTHLRYGLLSDLLCLVAFQRILLSLLATKLIKTRPPVQPRFFKRT
jgi:hypothetical protein